jgi:hypothetical protein
MSRVFVTSAPVERAFMTRKSWQHPSRREHIHGPLVPADPLVEFGRSIPSGKICVGIAVLVGVVFGHAFLGDAFGPRPRASHGAPSGLHHSASVAIAEERR